MYKNNKIAVIIPALNEVESLPFVIENIPSYCDSVFIIDNGSTDGTFELLKKYEAAGTITALRENRRGYGHACLKAMAKLTDENIVVFCDADFSDDPAQMHILLDPIIGQNADCVVTNRFTHKLETGAMSPVQRFGNKLSVFLIGMLWGKWYKDLGPFRSIRRELLLKLDMRDKNYGWTIELQVKAASGGLDIREIDVPYKRRVRGESKVGSTFTGAMKAGAKILYKILSLRFRPGFF